MPRNPLGPAGHITYIGDIWQPGVGTCAQRQSITRYDLDNIEDPTDRDSVECWLSLHSGDFQSVEDFAAFITLSDGTSIEHDWQHPESEDIYRSCMFPEDGE